MYHILPLLPSPSALWTDDDAILATTAAADPPPPPRDRSSPPSFIVHPSYRVDSSESSQHVTAQREGAPSATPSLCRAPSQQMQDQDPCAVSPLCEVVVVPVPVPAAWFGCRLWWWVTTNKLKWTYGSNAHQRISDTSLDSAVSSCSTIHVYASGVACRFWGFQLLLLFGTAGDPATRYHESMNCHRNVCSTFGF